jgi:hypothetical protein
MLLSLHAKSRRAIVPVGVRLIPKSLHKYLQRQNLIWMNSFYALNIDRNTPVKDEKCYPSLPHQKFNLSRTLNISPSTYGTLLFGEQDI